MDLTPSLVRSKAEAYRESQPLAAVEQDHVEMLPKMLASGDFGWRDVEWVVQWYFRRDLGAYPDEARLAAEEAFEANTYEEVEETLGAVAAAEDLSMRLDRLTALAGVDARIASAFLLFMFPTRYVVVGENEWGVLQEAGDLADPYPDPPMREDYLSYDEGCRDLAERCEVDAWTLYRALWLLGRERADAG